MSNHIIRKITDKLGSRGIRKDANFLLVPVVWALYYDIKAVLSFYEEEQPDFQNTLIPMGYVVFSDGNGKSKHVFGPIGAVANAVK